MAKKEKNQNSNEVIDPASAYVGSMDKILNFQRDRSLNIYQRINEVMKEVWYIKKQEKGRNPYDTVEHDDVTRKIRPSMVRHGIVAPIQDLRTKPMQVISKEQVDFNTQEVITKKDFFTEANMVVRFTNIDNPNDFTDVYSYAHGIDNAGNATGKAISYAYKYALLKTFNLETGDREDTDHLIEHHADENAVELYNEIGEELFGDKWEVMSKKKVMAITRGKTAEIERAPMTAVNKAIKNLYALKKKKNENPDKDIEEINEEQDKEDKGSVMNDILKDFQD